MIARREDSSVENLFINKEQAISKEAARRYLQREITKPNGYAHVVKKGAEVDKPNTEEVLQFPEETKRKEGLIESCTV